MLTKYYYWNFFSRALREPSARTTIRYAWRLKPGERNVPACLSYIVEGDRIRLPGNPGGVRFDFPIGDVVESDDAIVICLRVPRRNKYRENVYAIDHKGNLLWRVRPLAFGSQFSGYIALSANGKLVRLHARDGSNFDVDARTGTTVEPSGAGIG